MAAELVEEPGSDGTCQELGATARNLCSHFKGLVSRQVIDIGDHQRLSAPRDGHVKQTSLLL